MGGGGIVLLTWGKRGGVAPLIFSIRFSGKGWVRPCIPPGIRIIVKGLVPARWRGAWSSRRAEVRGLTCCIDRNTAHKGTCTWTYADSLCVSSGRRTISCTRQYAFQELLELASGLDVQDLLGLFGLWWPGVYSEKLGGGSPRLWQHKSRPAGDTQTPAHGELQCSPSARKANTWRI